MVTRSQGALSERHDILYYLIDLMTITVLETIHVSSPTFAVHSIQVGQTYWCGALQLPWNERVCIGSLQGWE